MGPEEIVRYFINPTGNLFSFAPNQGFKTMPTVQRIVELVVGVSCSQGSYRESKTWLRSFTLLHYVWNESVAVYSWRGIRKPLTCTIT
jgi:hypothetical protein